MEHLKVIQILNHKKTPTGTFLYVLFITGHSAWLALHIAIQTAPELTLHYLHLYPDLQEYHAEHNPG